jgi:hypothetical protein
MPAAYPDDGSAWNRLSTVGERQFPTLMAFFIKPVDEYLTQTKSAIFLYSKINWQDSYKPEAARNQIYSFTTVYLAPDNQTAGVFF